MGRLSGVGKGGVVRVCGQGDSRIVRHHRQRATIPARRQSNKLSKPAIGSNRLFR